MPIIVISSKSHTAKLLWTQHLLKMDFIYFLVKK